MRQLQKLKTKSDYEYLIPQSTLLFQDQKGDNKQIICLQYQLCFIITTNHVPIQWWINALSKPALHYQWRIQTGSQGFWNLIKISKFEWIWAKITFFVRVFWLRTQSKFCLDPPLTTTGMLHSPPPPPPLPPHLEPHDNMIQYLPICHKSHLYLNRVNLIQCVYIITHEVILFGLLTPSWNESWHTVLPSIKSWNSKYLIQLTQIQL